MENKIVSITLPLWLILIIPMVYFTRNPHWAVAYITTHIYLFEKIPSSFIVPRFQSLNEPTPVDHNLNFPTVLFHIHLPEFILNSEPIIPQIPIIVKFRQSLELPNPAKLARFSMHAETTKTPTWIPNHKLYVYQMHKATTYDIATRLYVSLIQITASGRTYADTAYW